MRDGSSWVEPVLSYDKCVLLKDHNAVTPVRLEPAALRSRVKHSTTEPLRCVNLHMLHIAAILTAKRTITCIFNSLKKLSAQSSKKPGKVQYNSQTWGQLL